MSLDCLGLLNILVEKACTIGVTYVRTDAIRGKGWPQAQSLKRTQKCLHSGQLPVLRRKNKLSQVCITKAANALHVAKKPLSPYTHLLDRLKWKDPILFLQKPIMDWKKRNEKSFQLESHHTSVGIYFLSRFL